MGFWCFWRFFITVTQSEGKRHPHYAFDYATWTNQRLDSSSAQAIGSSPQSHLHSSPSSPSILSSLTFRTIPCNQRHRGFFSKDHHPKNTPSTTYSPYLDNATTPIPPTDPMTDHTARSTHPLPSGPYSDNDTQPIVQATIPAPTPAAGTGAAMTDPFNPSSIQPAAAATAVQIIKNKGAGVVLSRPRSR